MSEIEAIANTKPAVSVIIPTYNRSWGLLRAVKSVLSQTFEDFELIVVDDCSQDDTPQVIQTLPDPRIRYFRQPQNVGVAENWGTGLQMARGEFVTFLMDDDFYQPHFLENRIQPLRSDQELCVVFSSYILCDQDGKPGLERIPVLKHHTKLDSEKLLESILHQSWFIGASMYRKAAIIDLWELAKQDDLIVDYSLAIHLALKEKGYGLYLDTRDFCMAYHPGQNSHTRRGEVLNRIDQVLSRLLEEPLQPEYRRLICLQLSNWKVMRARNLDPASQTSYQQTLKLILGALSINIRNVWAWRQLCKFAFLGKL